MSLKTLAFFHFLLAGLVGLAVIGTLIQGFTGIGFSISLLMLAIVGVVVASCILILSKSLQHRQNYLFCVTVSACECVIIPFGTILGLMTIQLLLEPEVKRQFISTSDPQNKDSG